MPQQVEESIEVDVPVNTAYNPHTGHPARATTKEPPWTRTR